MANAFLTGLFTKLADVANDDGFKISRGLNIFLGILWGFFGALVAIGNPDVAAFYLGILLSWIHRYKLDNYSHGIGGSIILAAIFYIHPATTLQVVITVMTFVLFTGFGMMTRHKVIKSSFFTAYNVYSFLFLVALSFAYPNVWIVVGASIANVVGYHAVKEWWKAKLRDQFLPRKGCNNVPLRQPI